MGKFFHGKNKYSDEEFEDDEMLEEDDRIESDDEIDEDFTDDEDSEEDFEEDEDSEEDFEEDEDSEEDFEEDEDSEEDFEEDEYSEEDFEEDEYSEEDFEEDEDSEEDFEEDSDEEDDDEYEPEDERRVYRRRRRIRNQLISYAVVIAVMSVIIAGGVVLGKNIIGGVKERKLAEKQAETQAELQAQLEAEAAHEVVIDAPEPIDEEPEVDYLGEIVDSCLSTMPLEDKVAGMFIVTPEALTDVATATKAGDGTQDALNEYAVGGLIYFDKNIKDKEQITEMLAGTTAMSRYPIFLAVDEEGGSVSRVAGSGIDVIQVGDMASIGETGDTAQAYEAGLTIGTYLKELGFNLDFAPVADVAGVGGNAMGDRVFGSDVQMVGDMVSNMVEGIEGTEVSSCLKHFPGIGGVEGDTHDGRVETTKTLEEMRNSDFIPFKAGIDAGADFVMVSHVIASAVEEDAVPSTLSKVIMTDILRNELGFQGIIITDAMNMKAVTEYYTAQEAAVMAIEAGADMILMPEDFNTAYEAVLAAVQDGTISEERINESLRRIYRVKCAGKLEQ